MKKKFLVFLVILIILGGVYYYFFYFKNFDFGGKIFEKLKEKLKNVENVKERTLKELEQVKEEKVSDVKEKANEFAASQKDKIISNFKDKLGDLILNFSDSLNKVSSDLKEEKTKEIIIPFNEKFYFPPPQASIILKVKTLFSLAINSQGKYEVNWGDGTIDQGEIKENKIFIVTHFFQEVGDYEVKVKIEKDGDYLNYNFPVRVY